MYNAEIGVGCNSSGGCRSDSCSSPDLCIKKGDTSPAFRVAVSDCEGVVDLSDGDYVVEANMWFGTKLKSYIPSTDTDIRFADNSGFEQVRVGDVIQMKRSRNPELMLVTSIDESEKTIGVARGHDSTIPQPWDRGAELRVYRIRNGECFIESVFEDVTSMDGAVSNELVDTFLVFKWGEADTSMPGCYMMEFKLVKLDPETSEAEWVKTLPLSKEGYSINVMDSSHI